MAKTFDDWYKSTPAWARRVVAADAGTSAEYLRHLAYRRRRPQHDTMKRIAEASRGELSYASLRDWFYPE